MNTLETLYSALINYLGVPAIIVIVVCVASLLKNRANEESNTAATKKERQLWRDTANALGMLETIGKNYVAGLDKTQATNSEKQKAATAQLQLFADNHNIPVSTEYLHGIIESKVNDLRAKQGIAQNGSSDNNNQTVVITDEK